MADLDKFKNKGDELYKRAMKEGFSTDRKGVMVVDNYDEENTSMIGNINPSRFIVVNGERYFVKYPTIRTEAQSYEVFVETFISFLSKKLGIDCVDQRVLIDHKLGAVGIASRDFGEHITLDAIGSGLTRGVDNVQKVIDTIKFKDSAFDNVEIDYDALADELNRRACFDYLVKQTDRHSGNIALQIDKGEDEKLHLGLAPLFDNGNALVVPSIHYNFETNDDEVYARGQQELLNGKFKDMLDFFDENFSEENFPKLMDEFNEEYGISELLDEATYKTLLIKAQETVRDRLYYCHKRENAGKIVSPEATYLMIRNHGSEYFNQNPESRPRIHKIAEYYSREKGSKKSFDSFTSGRGGEYTRFDHFEEAEEIDKTLSFEERTQISAEIEKRKRGFGLIVLDEIGKGKTFNGSAMDEYYTEYVLMDAPEKALREKSFPVQKQLRTAVEVGDIVRNHGLFVELRGWYDEQYARGDLSHEEKKELKRAQKILNRYIRHVNATTNRQLSQSQINALNGVELEEGIKERL